ncbi:flagellar assembly protein A [Paenibacillus agricola]|uniref:FapA family protein n=1 Tax=Paenibacillus agricola TaxID=2716264 RepID=A0ABX0JHI9_9BACL|nr:flagellar assembly protein A [Paenibacillus agricola]NHN35423.1 FapA family protein [Paenibacillus agricola]
MTTKANSVTSKGKTVKKAVQVALDLLDRELDDVEIEIIENDSKGILGLGSKLAVVRVTVKEIIAQSGNASADSPSEAEISKMVRMMDLSGGNSISSILNKEKVINVTTSDLSGKVWVADGQIFCKDALDKYPLLSPGPGIKLYKNDELIETTVIVREEDVLRMDLEDETREPQWELTISDDKMKAVLKVIPGVHIYKRLKEKGPETYIQLEVEEKKIPIMIETDAVMGTLRAAGITYGINYSELALACTTDDGGSFIIATGKIPTRGENGFFQPAQEVEIKKGIKERPDGSIDYREIRQFPSVDRGQVLGTIQPPTKGIPGTNVTNEPVLPPDVYPLHVQEGKGVVLVEDGYKVVATEPGHPDILVRGKTAKISVISKLLIGTDVTIQVGNVRYIGAVEIVGSVQDGMLVEAQGSVLVHENVNMATVTAGSSVIVNNNIISSAITAGSSSLLFAEIHLMLGDLIRQMTQMVAAMQQLSTVSAFKVSSFSRTGLGPLIKILCDGKFKTFSSLAISFINQIKNGQEILDEEWIQFSERLYKGFIMTQTSDFRSIEEVIQVVKKGEELYAVTQEHKEESGCFIKAGFAHYSQLSSSGDISIIGQGVYNSKLHAGGFVEIAGYVRGGEIFAAKGVKVGEVGTKGGTTTKITVPQGQSIRIKTAMEDTVIQIGPIVHKFTVQMSNIHARLDEYGQLVLS